MTRSPPERATGALPVATYSSGSGFVSATPEIIEELRNGRMVILADAEDRENEGDLIVAAQMATPDAVNFMAKHGRGLICLSLTQSRANDLRLDPMVRQNGARNRTAFTVSIEAREGISTGISAHDRAHTIATAIDPTKNFAHIVSPGHIFPLTAREGGVLVRAGHTEASVDLMRQAGLYPAAVICEIMNEDGTMARMPDLVAFAQRHNLKVGTIEDLIRFRLAHDRIVDRVASTSVDTAFGAGWRMHVYQTTVEPAEHIALVKGDVAAPGPVLVRVHVASVPGDLLSVGRAPGAPGGLEAAMRAIESEGRGVLVLLRDLNPKSMSAWVERHERTRRGGPVTRQARQIENGIGAQILRDLGVRDMVVLTHSPSLVYVGLDSYGLKVVGTREIG